RFGKVLQQRQSMTINRNDKSTSISTQMDSLIPASKISNLTQGMFVGAVSDNFDERIDQKIFHAEIVVDSAKVSAEMKVYQPIPIIADFINEDGSDNLKETIEANYKRVKQDILSLVSSEIERIKNNPHLSHLI
ncbi:MAG: conjugal transfer protein TraG, partial [Prevotella salivae]|nr:conjugal transfer protein TraG [Segatella salivae]